MGHLYHFLPTKAQEHILEGDRKTVNAKCGRCLQEKDSWAQRTDDTDKVTLIVRVYTRPAQAQSRQNPNMKEGCGYEGPPLNQEMLSWFL